MSTLFGSHCSRMQLWNVNKNVVTLIYISLNILVSYFWPPIDIIHCCVILDFLTGMKSEAVRDSHYISSVGCTII